MFKFHRLIGILNKNMMKCRGTAAGLESELSSNKSSVRIVFLGVPSSELIGVSEVATAKVSEPTMRRAIVRSSLRVTLGDTFRLFTFDSEIPILRSPFE